TIRLTRWTSHMSESISVVSDHEVIWQCRISNDLETKQTTNERITQHISGTSFINFLKLIITQKRSLSIRSNSDLTASSRHLALVEYPTKADQHRSKVRAVSCEFRNGIFGVVTNSNHLINEWRGKRIDHRLSLWT